MRYPLLLILLSTLSLYAGTLRVAAASNTAYAMNALVKAFEAKHPGIRVETVLGSSGKLTAQITNGAPFDLFLSANEKYPKFLAQQGFGASDARVYAQGLLILFSRSPRSLAKGIDICSDSSVTQIAIANPRLAPYGIAAKEALTNAGLWKRQQSKFVKAENIGQALQYAMTQTDLGFVAKSAIYSPTLSAYRGQQHWVDVDPALYAPINQALIRLKASKNGSDADAFVRFLFSDEGRAIFKSYGYLTP